METMTGDLILIHHKDQPMGFARVEDIVADVKPGWWQLTLLLLQLPTAKVTWILREEYIDGGEFTMGGETMRLERLPRPQGQAAPQPETFDTEDQPKDQEDKPKSKGKVLSLAERRKNKDKN
jgi:hypothetical protein